MKNYAIAKQEIILKNKKLNHIQNLIDETFEGIVAPESNALAPIPIWLIGFLSEITNEEENLSLKNLLEIEKRLKGEIQIHKNNLMYTNYKRVTNTLRLAS